MCCYRLTTNPRVPFCLPIMLHNSHQMTSASSGRPHISVPDTWSPVWSCGRWNPAARILSRQCREPWSSLPSWGQYVRRAPRWWCPAAGRRRPQWGTPVGLSLWNALGLSTSVVRWRNRCRRLRQTQCDSDTRRRSSWTSQRSLGFWIWPPAAPRRLRRLGQEEVSRRGAGRTVETAKTYLSSQWRSRPKH